VKRLLLSTLLSMCTPGTPTPAPAPPAPPPIVVVDGGCEGARQLMVNLGCPPEEDAFGGWVNECAGWSHAGVVTGCIQSQSTCAGTRQCLGEAK
jgi:hypothetical protein